MMFFISRFKTLNNSGGNISLLSTCGPHVVSLAGSRAKAFVLGGVAFRIEWRVLDEVDPSGDEPCGFPTLSAFVRKWAGEGGTMIIEARASFLIVIEGTRPLVLSSPIWVCRKGRTK